MLLPRLDLRAPILLRFAAVCAATLLILGRASAQVPVEQLAVAPADAQRFQIVSGGGTHGQIEIWKRADGALVSRDSLNLRGQKFETEETVTFDANGVPASVVVRGFTPSGDAAETFTAAAGKAQWKSQIDAGDAPFSGHEIYQPAGGGFIVNTAILTEALIASSTKSVAMLPGGKATIERLTQATVGEGTAQKTIVCWAIGGIASSPTPVWATEDGRFFGIVVGLGFLPVGYENELKPLGKAQDDAMSARSPALAKALVRTPTGAVAFSHVRAFVDGKKFAEDQTVVVEAGVITKVGPAATTPAPHGAQIIDGKGMTLVPGLWDSHLHVGDDNAGPYLLSLGITSGRDPGNDNSLTVARAARRAKGELLMPKIYASSLIDGKGPNSAQIANVATTLDEALGLVRQAHADGMTGVKFYGTFNSAWVAPAAAEAHRLGMHVHGHLPVGMRTHEAIEAGYDEVTHIYFVMMEAMPDDIVKTSNGINRMQGPGRYAKDVDLAAEPMKSLIATMAQRKIVSDPTLVIVEALLASANGEVSPSYAPFVGTMPPAVERGFRQGGLSIPPDLTRADFRQSFDKLVALVGAMHRAGVPIVAGTDGTGAELVRELELYVQAGLTTAEALAAATIVAAHNVGADKHTGSIEVGKAADLVLVEGDPSKQIGDLRHTRVVMMDGKLMDADTLRQAGGFSARPKWQD